MKGFEAIDVIDALGPMWSLGLTSAACLALILGS